MVVELDKGGRAVVGPRQGGSPDGGLPLGGYEEKRQRLEEERKQEYRQMAASTGKAGRGRKVIETLNASCT